MAGFDSSTFFSTINTSITNTGNNALSQARSIGQQPSIALSSTITTAKNLPSLPIFGGLSIKDVEGIFVPPAKSGLNATIDNLTGINIAQTIGPNGAATITKYTSQYATTLIGQVYDAIQLCINQKLLSLAQKNPIAGAIFNYFFNRSALVGNILETPTMKVRKEVNTFLYQKIQIQQFTLLKQQITKQIQQVCNNADPTTLRNYNTSPNYISTVATKTSTNIGNSITNSSTPASVGWSKLI